MTLLLGLAGLAIDIGRMYVIRAELQSFTDAAALSAALQLNGTDPGLVRARAGAGRLAKGPHAMRWDMGTQPITQITTSFSSDQGDVAGAAQGARRSPFRTRVRHRAGAHHLSEGFSAAHVHHGCRRERGRQDRTVGEVDAMRRRTKRGSALIEFAGSLILLSVMFSGIFEIGYSFYTYGELVTAVRAGARYAALQPRGSAADPAIAKAVRNLVVYGDPAPADRTKPLVPGLTTDQVELVNGPDASTVSLHGFQLDALFMKVNLDGRPTVTFPVTAGAAQ